MPELPEVETTKRGIAPHVVSQCVTSVIVREPRLRWPVPDDLADILSGQTFDGVSRRAKYLLLETETGALMVHLGMSGSLRLVSPSESLKKHDHIDIGLSNGLTLRYHDPRRFGSVHWLNDVASHPLLSHLGPEPLSEDFNSDYLFAKSRGRTSSVKQFIMDAKVVVGVGNIYANEALFMSGIRPDRAANRISSNRYQRLVQAIKEVLDFAIGVGGTTLRDFVGGDGKAGYFAQQLSVYGRGGQACTSCGRALKEIRQSNRSSVFCQGCQR